MLSVEKNAGVPGLDSHSVQTPSAMASAAPMPMRRGMSVNADMSSFKVHKGTGRRVAVRNADADHLVQQDERLRIIDDELFQKAQQRLAGRRRGRRGPYLRSEARPFTGLIFCETCGSICYRRKSKNAKGEYHYYGCGCRQG